MVKGFILGLANLEVKVQLDLVNRSFFLKIDERAS
jgi:hypothetical protein